MLFWYQLRKMAPIYSGTDDLWRAENWPKLVSSLVSRYVIATVIVVHCHRLQRFSEALDNILPVS